MTQRLFLKFSELQVRVDGVNATSRHRDAVDAAVREYTWFRDGVRSTQIVPILKALEDKSRVVIACVERQRRESAAAPSRDA